LQDHCKLYTTSKAKLKDLIQKVLRHPDFDPDQVDHDMHERLMQAIEEEDILIWDKWEEAKQLFLLPETTEEGFRGIALR